MRVISHYRLERPLGVGGMGEVFLARDVALGRDCALKLLAKSFSETTHARLVHEARTCARLQHPGIASFYESGADDGEFFIAMEFVRGQTLRQRLTQGPMASEAVMNLARLLLEALGHAHAVGILHRDIKPENIMLPENGGVKLLDFGLAKELANPRNVEAPTVTLLTGQGAIVGTVGYMSPEQLRGETLDETADLFSVGAVLYEALSGRPAFPGTTPMERIAAILSKDPEPTIGTKITTELSSAIQKSLSRDPKRRYLSAAAFMSDLRRIESGEPSSGFPNTLAVFDFTNLAGNAEDDWIGAGVAETLCTSLAQIPEFEVVPREKLLRTQASSDSGWDAQSLGLKLECRWLVNGSYQKMGSALRFTIRLIEPLTGETVMGNQIDGSCEAIFDLQDDLTTLVRDAIAQTAPNPPLPSKPRPSISAYECYIRGRQAWLSTEKSKLHEAQQWFERAVDVEPNYPPALAGLATVHALRCTFTTDSAALETAEEYARRAIEADAELSEPHVWLGYVHLHRGEPLDGFKEEQRAIGLDPANPLAYYFAAALVLLKPSRRAAEQMCGLISGNQNVADPHRYRREKALQLYQQALELNKSHGWSWMGAGMVHMELRNFAEAQWCLEQAMDLERKPERMTAGMEGCLGECLRRRGDLDGARLHCLNGIAAVEESDNIYRDTLRAIFLCTLGKVTLAQHDLVAARAAYSQAVQHMRGRNRARAGGHPFVQALAGLAETDCNAESFQEAIRVFREREDFDFGFFWCCSDDVTLLALARGAKALGQMDLARQLHSEAIDCGSSEAADVEIL